MVSWNLPTPKTTEWHLLCLFNGESFRVASFGFKDEVCGVDPTVFRRFYHEEVEEFDEDVAEPQYIDKRCDVSRPNVLSIFQSIFIIFIILT